MPTIKPRTKQKHSVRHITRLYRENNEVLFAYAAFIGEDTAYVLNQLIDAVLAKDREFLQWRTEHPESFLSARRRGRTIVARRQRQPLDDTPAATAPTAIESTTSTR